MKIIVKQLIIFVLGISVVISCGYIIGGERYLPWVKKEVVYVSLYTAESTKLENGHYSYQTSAVNSSGKEMKIHFEIAQQLAPGTYLKLYSKGNYTSQTEIISEKKIPPKALHILKK